MTEPGPDEHVITRSSFSGQEAATCSCNWETSSDSSEDVDEAVRRHEEDELGESTDVYLEDDDL